MNDFFKEIFEYTYYFNTKVLDVLLQDQLTFPEKSLQLLNHTINTQEVWNARIKQTPNTTTAWQMRPVHLLSEINDDNYKISLQIIDTFDFNQIIHYANSTGAEYDNSVKDILFHIVNHSTYHRGQIATDCKLNGIPPLVTDYSFYKRDSL